MAYTRKTRKTTRKTTRSSTRRRVTRAKSSSRRSPSARQTLRIVVESGSSPKLNPLLPRVKDRVL